LTSSYEGQLVVKLCYAEASAIGKTGERKSLINRINKMDPSHPPFTEREDGLAIEIQYRATAERWVKHPDINREGEEIYLDEDPSWAQFPSCRMALHASRGHGNAQLASVRPSALVSASDIDPALVWSKSDARAALAHKRRLMQVPD
jgi:hypothetical protein